MKTIIGISGSLRKGSFNSALLREAAKHAPPGVQIVIKSIEAFPLYNWDVEKESGIPTPVQELKDAISEAQGLLVATPEYNNSLPGVLKNAIDWLSRPSSDIERVFRGKPVAIMGASTGRFGTTLSQTAWLPVLRVLGTKPWFGTRLLIARANQVFGDDGEVKDDDVKEQIRKFVQGFAASI